MTLTGREAASSKHLIGEVEMQQTDEMSLSESEPIYTLTHKITFVHNTFHDDYNYCTID